MRLIPLVLLIVCAAHAPATPGLLTGSASGKLVDPAGAPVAGAAVSLVSEGAGLHVERRTGTDGNFVFPRLATGSYTLTVEAAGFQTLRLQRIAVAAGREAALGSVRLIPGRVDTVVVDANAAATPSDEAQPPTVFTAAMLQDLPLLGELDRLVELIPGSVAAQMQDFSVPAYITGLENGDFTVNGRSLRSNNFEIDGQPNNDSTVGGQQIGVASEDVLEEVQVADHNFRAENGPGTGAAINFITRSGTDRMHGSAFEFYTGSWLSSLQNDEKNPALGFCAPGKSAPGCRKVFVPRQVDNEFGGTLGGPLIPGKLWGFGGTYWWRSRSGDTLTSTGPSLTPTPDGLAALQALAPANPAVAALTQFGPYAIAAGSPRPVGRKTKLPVTIDGVRYPVEFAAVGRQLPGLIDDQQHTARLDWQPRDSDHFFARYLYQDRVDSPGGGSIAAGSFVNITQAAHSIAGDWSHTFSPSLVNQLRYSFQQTKLNQEGGAFPGCTVVDSTACPSEVAVGSRNVGFGYLNYFPQGRTMKTTQVLDNVTMNRGRHSLVFGGRFDFQNSPATALPYYNGRFSFANFNDFLAGVGFLRLSDGHYVTHFTEPDVAVYLADDIKATPNLTVSLGLRWELFGNPVNLLHDETVERESGANPLWSKQLPLAARTFPTVSNYYGNVEPRIGFAWSPEALNRKLAVRGGYSIAADPVFYDIYMDAATSAPVVNLGSIRCTGNCLPAGGTSSAAVRAQNLPLLPLGGNPNSRDQTTVARSLRQPYAQFYTLGVEYQLNPALSFSLRYAGDHSVGDIQSVNANPLVGPAASDFSGLNVPTPCTTPHTAGFGRTDCARSLVRSRLNTGFSLYHSVAAGLRAQSYHGVTATASYTFSRAIDNASDAAIASTSGAANSYSQNPLRGNEPERGVSTYSYPHVASLGLDWEIPLLPEQRTVWGRLFGGWSLNAIYSYHSGQAFTPFQQVTSSASSSALLDTSYCDGVFDGAFSTIPTGAISVCRPILSNPRAPLQSAAILLNDQQAKVLTAQGVAGYYLYNAVGDRNSGAAAGLYNQPVDPASVHWIWNNRNAAVAAGSPYAGVSRNTLRGRPLNNLDAGLYKDFPLSEPLTLELRATAQNLMNHQYIRIPDNNIDDSLPGAGVNPFLSEAYLASNHRTVTLGVKLTF